MALNFRFHQIRGWQKNRVYQSADSMAALKYFIPSEAILTREGVKGDSNVEETFRAIGIKSDEKIKIGGVSTTGEAVLLKAAAFDKAQKAGSMKAICDGNHKFAAVLLVFFVCGIELIPIVREVPAAMADRVAEEANLAQKTSADLAGTEILQSIVNLRKLGVYQQQKDLPFGDNDRGNHQNYWWRSEAVVVKGYAPEKVAKLPWQVCRSLVEGKSYDEAILAHAKKKEQKIVKAESIKLAGTMASNADPKMADLVTKILVYASTGEDDQFKKAVADYYAAKNNPDVQS